MLKVFLQEWVVSTNRGADCRCSRSAVLEEMVEVVRFILERIQHRTVGEIVDVPVLLFHEQIAEVIKVILQQWG